MNGKKDWFSDIPLLKDTEQGQEAEGEVSGQVKTEAPVAPSVVPPPNDDTGAKAAAASLMALIKDLERSSKGMEAWQAEVLDSVRAAMTEQSDTAKDILHGLSGRLSDISSTAKQLTTIRQYFQETYHDRNVAALAGLVTRLEQKTQQLADTAELVVQLKVADTPVPVNTQQSVIPGISNRLVAGYAGAGGAVCLLVGALLGWAMAPASPSDGRELAQLQTKYGAVSADLERYQLFHKVFAQAGNKLEWFNGCPPDRRPKGTNFCAFFPTAPFEAPLLP